MFRKSGNIQGKKRIMKWVSRNVPKFVHTSMIPRIKKKNAGPHKAYKPLASSPGFPSISTQALMAIAIKVGE